MNASPPPTRTRRPLHLRVTAAAESAIRSGHPWVYAESIRSQTREGTIGELAVIYDRKDQFLAIGLFDPDSPLRVRIVHLGKPVAVDTTFWSNRLGQAISRRTGLFDGSTTGYRWIYGESDGWPGLVLDRYDATLVVKLYTAAWLPRIQEIASLIQQHLKPERLVLRLSRNIQTTAHREFSYQDGAILYGPPLEGPVVFLETGLRFEAEVVRGQKTGFFLDQRENRQRVGALAAGLNVLNVFSFSGAFSVYAARGGARSVTDLDISPHALKSAERNFALNRETTSNCGHEVVQADAFEWLEQAPPRHFGLVVLDPPSLAKRAADVPSARTGYRRLVRGAANRLANGGVLVAASCSAHITAQDFFQLVRSTLQEAGHSFRELECKLHPADHPATFAEAEYLKCIYLRMSPKEARS